MDADDEEAGYGEAVHERPLKGKGKRRNGSSPQDEEVVGDIVEQAKQVQRVAEKIYFLSVLKRFGLAFAGILILLGTISATAFFLIFFGVFATGLPASIELVIEIALAMLAIIHILAGLALLAG